MIAAPPPFVHFMMALFVSCMCILVGLIRFSSLSATHPRCREEQTICQGYGHLRVELIVSSPILFALSVAIVTVAMSFETGGKFAMIIF